VLLILISSTLFLGLLIELILLRISKQIASFVYLLNYTCVLLFFIFPYSFLGYHDEVVLNIIGFYIMGSLFASLVRILSKSLFSNRYIKRPFTAKSHVIQPTRIFSAKYSSTIVVRYLAAMWVFIAAVDVYNGIIASDGLFNLLILPKSASHLGEGYFNGLAVFQFMKIPLLIGYLMWCEKFFVNRRFYLGFILAILPAIHYLLMSATRFGVIVYILSAIAVFIYYKSTSKPYTSFSKMKISVYTIVSICIVAIYMSIGNAIRGGYFFHDPSLSLFYLIQPGHVFLELIRAVDYVQYLGEIAAYIEIGIVEIEYFAGTVYYNIISFMPRLFWDDKPITAIGPRVTQAIYGDVGYGRAIRTYTFLGEGFLQFHYVGVLLSGVIFPYLYKKVVYFISKYTSSLLVTMVYLVEFITHFRGQFPLVKMIVVIFSVVIIITAIRVFDHSNMHKQRIKLFVEKKNERH
jgi:hypothetical protein